MILSESSFLLLTHPRPLQPCPFKIVGHFRNSQDLTQLKLKIRATALQKSAKNSYTL